MSYIINKRLSFNLKKIIGNLFTTDSLFLFVDIFVTSERSINNNILIHIIELVNNYGL